MLDFLHWFEGSALGEALRGANVWTYGLLNLGHILGLSTLFGAILVLDLRLLGLWRDIPMINIARPTVPLSACGFALAVITGILMFSVNASEYYGNPFMFYIKFPAIGVGMLNIIAMSFFPAWRERKHREPNQKEKRQLTVAGAVSLLSWLTAIAGGRMIGYW